MNKYTLNRELMKSGICDINIIATADIAKGIPQPPLEKPYSKGSKKIVLPTINSDSAPKADFFACISNRCSRRNYTDEPLSLFELAFLLWCTQGVKKVISGYRKYIKDGSGRNLLRSVPVGGCVNSYETYLAINNVSDVDTGIWRYLPLSHELLFIKPEGNLKE